MPATTQQISILARVRALEERVPAVESRVRRYLPVSEGPAGRNVGQGTLLGRVAALERAMDAVLVAQQAALDEAQQRAAEQQPGCCSCCAVM